MAKAIHYKARAPSNSDGAYAELDKLLHNLHEQGTLRFLNDLVPAAPETAEMILSGLNIKESQNAVQNLVLLAIALGRIPPERFGVLTRAFTEALDSMEEAATDEEEQKTPGLLGFYQLLQDRELWEGLRPVIAGVRGFSRPLHEAPEKPAAKRNDGSGTNK